MFIIEDRIHAENNGEFATLAEATAELQRRAAIPWDEPPNCAPCASWRRCGREYDVLEFDCSETPAKLLRRLPALKISAAGIEWERDFK
jgi:hypothetical protein